MLLLLTLWLEVIGAQVLPRQGGFRGDCMQPVDLSPPSQFLSLTNKIPRPEEHPPGTGPLETNKFFTNLALENRTAPIWTHPYRLAWTGTAWPHGIVIATQQAAPVTLTSPEFEKCGTSLSTSNMTHMSVGVILRSNKCGLRTITMPLVSGMGFVTAEYHNTAPVLVSQVPFSSVTVSPIQHSSLEKYHIELRDGHGQWLVYISKGCPLRIADDNTLIASTTDSYCLVQLVSVPALGVSLKKRDHRESEDTADDTTNYQVSVKTASSQDTQFTHTDVAYKTVTANTNIHHRPPHKYMFRIRLPPKRIFGQAPGQKAKATLDTDQRRKRPIVVSLVRVYAATLPKSCH